MIDLDAYLERIGLSGRPGLHDVHRAHVLSIPFENLDPLRGVHVSLDPDDLEGKLVSRRRGGYCFEQNLLLKAALEALGMEVEPMLARVRWGAPPGSIRPRSHLVLRVRLDGDQWLADVGFGRGSLIDPVPFGPGAAYEQLGWRFRVVGDGDMHVLEMSTSEGWADMYGFLPEPVPHVDIETSNWYTTSHPRSPFVTKLIVSVTEGDGRCVTLSDREELSLTEETPGTKTVTSVDSEAIPELLAERFGLPGWRLATDGRPYPQSGI
jgi:N-hydroxyarylamine O-acetyltransferase